MTRYARIAGALVAEIIALPEGLAIEDAFHPDFVARCVPAPVEVKEGWSFAAGEFSPPEPPPEPSLDVLKDRLMAAVDAAAEAERLRYITGGAGQAMEYQQAAAEANALLALLAADPAHVADPAAYPMLAASLGVDGDTLADVAATVAGMNRQWQALGSAIRAVRLAAKRNIELAETAEAARAVTVTWPEPA